MKDWLQNVWDTLTGRAAYQAMGLYPAADGVTQLLDKMRKETEMLKLKIHQGKDKQWYVRLVGANGRIMLSSEGYTRRDHAVRACCRLNACQIEYAEGSK